VRKSVAIADYEAGFVPTCVRRAPPSARSPVA